METRCLTFISEAHRASGVKRRGVGGRREASRQGDNGGGRVSQGHREEGAGGWDREQSQPGRH